MLTMLLAWTYLFPDVACAVLYFFFISPHDTLDKLARAHALTRTQLSPHGELARAHTLTRTKNTCTHITHITASTRYIYIQGPGHCNHSAFGSCAAVQRLNPEQQQQRRHRRFAVGRVLLVPVHPQVLRQHFHGRL